MMTANGTDRFVRWRRPYLVGRSRKATSFDGVELKSRASDKNVGKDGETSETRAGSRMCARDFEASVRFSLSQGLSFVHR